MSYPQILIASTAHVLALNKPSGLITHRDGRNEEPSLCEWVGEQYPALRGIGGEWVSPQGESIPLNGVVHRLDKQTSGVVLVAKDEETFAALKGEFKARRVGKTYIAYVHGHIAEAGEVVAEIARSTEAPKRWYAKPCAKDNPRAAITAWYLVKHLSAEGGEPVSLIEVQPKTGRTHQIRVHLASIGHPIIADYLYGEGGQTLLGFKRLALHALRIELAFGGDHFAYEAPPPEDFGFTSMQSGERTRIPQ